MIHKYGWKPDLPDFRDVMFAPPPDLPTLLPPELQLRDIFPPAYNQHALGSCTGNAIAGAVQFDRRVQKLEDWTPSRLLIYYMERAKEHTITEDSGAQIRVGIKCISKQGTCPESFWPYNVDKFTERPPQAVFDISKLHPAVEYRSVPQKCHALKACIASGFPFVFGFSVYDSFESDVVSATGLVPMPDPRESRLGGHAVLACGYNDHTQEFTVRNSWGAAWGDGGYCYMPYNYLTNPQLARDFWVVRMVR